MTISQNGIDFIKEREGFSAKCYYDGAQSSIGYGTKCGTKAHASGLHSITRADAETAMRNEINRSYIPNVRRQTSGIEMNQNQFDALVSFTYNTGGGTSMIKNSPLVKYLRGEMSQAEATSAFQNYVVTNSATGKVDSGLQKRRRLEAELFFSGVVPPKPAPTLTVSTGNSSIETTFSWNTVEGATEYDVKIWKGTVWEGDAYLVEWGASNPYSVVLPEGTYQAYVDARFGSDMQMSNIVEFTVKAGCKLNVEVGNSSAETKFTWNDVNNATEYDVKIWKGKAWEGDPYLVEWGASNPYSVILPEGTYQAYVDTRFGSDMQMSNIVEFTVKAGCKLNVEVGNTSVDTVFSWNAVNGATGYDVKIWKGKLWEGDPYLIEWGASSPFSVALPEGTYQAYVDTRFGSDMQMSNVVEFTIKAGCKLNVEVGNTSAETKFTWNDVNNATGYDVKIWKGKVWEGDPCLIEWGASNPYSVVLPEGTYQAYVDTRFGSDMQMSNIVTFNVTKAKIQIGDLNSDNTLTAADAVLLQRYLLQERTLTQSQWQTADLNADGTVNGFDLALLRQKLA
ncbi:dockerin type I domain-containing protein [uncultured Ruminococcus sp.]|uniref:glycoside hydrolase family protein n=1 Tax=uncultured Ruminococcus sp. TaxID=165186 RepID=UPI0026775D38|nr:dockerin type I domain-containing protein [uncultured Ruminococcus sp.]